MKKDNILDTIVFVIFCVLAISVIFLQNHLNILFVVIGIVMVLVGILYAFMKKKVSSLIIGFGISILLTSFLYYKHMLSFGSSVVFFMSFSLDITILLTIIVMSINRLLLNKEYEIRLEAEVIDLIRNRETKVECYMPVYRYKYKNNSYEVDAGCYISKDIPNIGDKKAILINKKDPTKVFILPSKKQVIFNYFGLSFLLVCITIVIISLFR